MISRSIKIYRIASIFLIAVIVLNSDRMFQSVLANMAIINIVEKSINILEFDTGENTNDLWQCGIGLKYSGRNDALNEYLLKQDKDLFSCFLLPLIRINCINGNIEAAEKYLKYADTSCNDRDLLLIIKGDLEFSRGDLDQATNSWLSTTDGFQVVWSRALSLRNQNRLSESLTILRIALENKPSVSWINSNVSLGSVYELMGEIAYQEREWSLVVESYQSAMNLKQIRISGYVYYAEALRETGHHDRSILVIQEGIRKYGENNQITHAILLEQLGATLAAQGDIKAAIDAYKQALDLFANNSPGINPNRIYGLQRNIERLSQP